MMLEVDYYRGRSGTFTGVVKNKKTGKTFRCNTGWIKPEDALADANKLMKEMQK